MLSIIEIICFQVLWSYKGEDISAFHDYSVLEEHLTEGIKSIMIIRDSKAEHFGTYNCTIINSYGSDSLDITLRAQS